MANDERALILAATGRDTRLTEEILREAGLEAVPCSSAEELVLEADRGAGLLILAEEILRGDARERLLTFLREQPSWSDLPIFLLAPMGRSVGRLLMALEGLGSVTILERPVQVATLLSVVRGALRARRRQYEVRDLLVRLQETDRRKDEFLAMLGHELRNPLGVIRTASELLELADGSASARRRQLDRIGHQVTHLTRMVDDLLDLSRVTRGKISLRKDVVDLRDVLEGALDSCIDFVHDRTEDLEMDLPDAPLWTNGDPTRLEQVVCNLLKNAAKYTPRGSAIRLEARGDGDRVVVRIVDQGVGIDPADLESIFDTFTQGKRTLARSSGGLGLGLPLARHLVELHDGSLFASSHGQGEGSEFTVTLPRAEPPESADAAASREETDMGASTAIGRHAGRPRILVVEDLAHAREALGELLTLAGYEVVLTPDGEAGLQSALENPPDVALVDIGLPGLDGYEVARRLREEAPGEIYLVAMTGYGQDKDRKRALEAGFDRHLVKPVNPNHLIGLLSRQTSEPEGNEAVGV